MNFFYVDYTSMHYRQIQVLLLALLSLAPLLLMWMGFYFFFQHTGFTIDKISSKIEYNQNWNPLPLSREDTDFLLHEVFSQPYYYLASGGLCYAFLSQDQRFVIKFFKMQNLNAKRSSLKNLFSRSENSSTSSLLFERVFTSYLDAYQELREETALIYVHFNKTQDLKAKVTLIDHKDKRYAIDLDTVEFVVQQTAEKIYEHLLSLKPEEAQCALRSFFDLIANRCKKGFSTQELSLRNNFGFCGKKAIQIDCTTLIRDDSMKYPHNFREEVMLIAERLNQWAQVENPDLCVFIQEEAQRTINERGFP